MKYRRSHAIELGRRLVAQDQMQALHRDAGGGLRWNAIGQFAPNPVFGMHPANVMQIPPMSGPGGYTSPPNQNTPPAAIMMAQQAQQAQAPMAHGGGVDAAAFADACRLLHHAKRAYGGQVAYTSGGEVKESAHVSEAKRLLALIDRIDRENPRVSADKRFSYACQRAPGLARFLKLLLQDGYSRSGARATIHGALIRWAEEE